MNVDLRTYYARRAREYERVYARPERQGELAVLRRYLREALWGRDVLEVACGTGYWTQEVATAARAVHALDINDEVLALARGKVYPRGNVSFERRDVLALDGAGERGFDAGLAAFWWSHVPVEDLRGFLAGLHRQLVARAVVVLVDNVYAPGSSTPVARRDPRGNTFQRRLLEDGSAHEVLKNFPTAGQLLRTLAPFAMDVECVWLRYFWYARYRVRPSTARTACP